MVHHITEESPIYQYSKEALKEAKMEVMVYIKAFDDHFSNTVQQRTSYTIEDLIYGARFLPMFERSPDGSYTILELDKINLHETVVLNNEN